MSSCEYNNMMLKCQKTAPYHVFTFDIVGSSKMDKETRAKAQYKFRDLVLLNYKMIEYIEKKKKMKILVRPFNTTSVYEMGYTQTDKEPVIIGDLSYFTIYRDTLTTEEVIDIFECCMYLLDVDFKFHYADGYYETHYWEEGINKYFRGYCISTLSTLHKPCNKKFRKLLEQAKSQEQSGIVFTKKLNIK